MEDTTLADPTTIRLDEITQSVVDDRTEVFGSTAETIRTIIGRYGELCRRDLPGFPENELNLIRDALTGYPPEDPKELGIKVRNNDDDLEDRIYRVQIDEIRSEDGQSLGWVSVLENVCHSDALRRRTQ